MFIALDYKRHQFLPLAHSSLETLCDLVVTEAHDVPVHIENVTYPFLGSWRDLDCIMLYKNTTGETATKIGDDLRVLLMELASRIPECSVNIGAAAQRAEQVELTGEPCKRIIVMSPIKLPKAPDEKEILTRPRARPVAREIPQAHTSTAGAGSAGPRSPRMGGAREIIWSIADTMWQAAGAPKDLPVILALRKEIMAKLENDHGVKRTTSSNELGNWQKAKLSN